MAKQNTMPRLKALYNETIANNLKNELKLENVHQVPNLRKS